MTVRERIIALMREHRHAQFTDGELAAYTDCPEPSVRRARLALERQGIIENADVFANRYTWRLAQRYRR